MLLDYLREAWTVNAQLQLQINKLPNFTKSSLPNCKSWNVCYCCSRHQLCSAPEAAAATKCTVTVSSWAQKLTNLLTKHCPTESYSSSFSMNEKSNEVLSLCLLFSNCLKLPSFDLSPPAYRCSCAPATPTREMPSQEQGWSVTLPSGPSLQETDHVLGITFLLLQGLHICHGPVSTPS